MVGTSRLVAVLGSVVSGAVGGLILAFSFNSLASKSSSGGPLPLLALVVFFFSLGIIPWLLLSRRWTFWLGSLIGALVGLSAASAAVFTLYPPNLNICIVGPCSPSTPPSTPLLESLLFGVIVLGIYGAGQAVSLRGAVRRFAWVLSSLVAGVALGVVIQVGLVAAGIGTSQLPLGFGAAAGAAAGGILGAGAVLLSSAQPLHIERRAA